MEKVVSRGVTGSKAKFIIDVGKHSLSFTTKLQDIDNLETNLPSEASIGKWFRDMLSLLLNDFLEDIYRKIVYLHN